MKRTVAVVTEDLFLYQKIYLILKPYATVSQVLDGDFTVYDSLLWDIDSAGAPTLADAITLGRNGAELSVPFSDSELVALITASERGAILRLLDGCAILRSKRIRLTEVEYNLLSNLVNAGGGFVSRDELLSAVWGRDAEASVLNVYIHYLREKLERDGEKIIISSRGGGYKIDEKYLREEEEC